MPSVTVARVALLPRPEPGEFPGELPRATDPHYCPPFCWPVALRTDSAGRSWAEWECQVCGGLFDVPASLEDFGLAAEPAPAATSGVPEPGPAEYRGWW